MKLCVPALTGDGLRAPVSEHFGSAPYFIIADTASGAWEAIPNGTAHHAHGMCHPLQALQGKKIDAVACTGIGAGAIGKLGSAGIKVYRATGPTVADIVAASKGGLLAEIASSDACAHHGCH